MGSGKVLLRLHQKGYEPMSSQSTLLQTLLGEIKPIEGTVAVNGVVSYASQNPWVFSGTLKENILFGSLFDVDRYNTVIQACTLNKVTEVHS